jgi:hypothetical protein
MDPNASTGQQQGQLGFQDPGGLQDPGQLGPQYPTNPNYGNDLSGGSGSGMDPRFSYGGNNGVNYRQLTDDEKRRIAAGDNSVLRPGETVNGYGQAVSQGPNGAALATQRYQQLGGQWGSMAPIYANMKQANGYLDMGDSTRSSQAQALALQQQAAMGNAPSAAQQMMQQGNADAMRNSLAMAGSARGAGAMGSAQYNAQQQNGLMSAQNTSAMGTLRAQEMAQARDAYMQGATGMRGQDYGAAGMTGGWAQNQADTAMKQRQLDLQGQLGYEQLGSHVQDQQLAAQIAGAGGDLAKWTQQTNLDRSATTDNIGAATSGASSGGGALGAIV